MDAGALGTGRLRLSRMTVFLMKAPGTVKPADAGRDRQARSHDQPAGAPRRATLRHATPRRCAHRCKRQLSPCSRAARRFRRRAAATGGGHRAEGSPPHQSANTGDPVWPRSRCFPRHSKLAAQARPPHARTLPSFPPSPQTPAPRTPPVCACSATRQRPARLHHPGPLELWATLQALDPLLAHCKTRSS